MNPLYMCLKTKQKTKWFCPWQSWQKCKSFSNFKKLLYYVTVVIFNGGRVCRTQSWKNHHASYNHFFSLWR